VEPDERVFVPPAGSRRDTGAGAGLRAGHGDCRAGRVKASGRVAEQDFAKVVGRISFFVNAGIKFITELSKMRAFTELWDEICRERYGVEDEKLAGSATACRSIRLA
jgi:hypothetical protein